jgi:enoyl-CoA hydratase/carnithine racemase
MAEYQKNYVWEKTGAIGVLSLHNPPENFISEPEFIDIEQIRDILTDKALKGLIINGTGRHFSAGANLDNLRQMARDEALLHKKISGGKDLIIQIRNLNIPVVASIRGVCFGAGLEIALACHIRVCSENALFAFPEANHGIMPGLGGTVMLSKLIGEGKSAEIILTGEIVNSQKAVELKLADYAVPVKELKPFSLNLLERMTSDREIEVIHSVMRSINNSQNLPFENALREETKLFCALVVKSMQKKAL